MGTERTTTTVSVSDIMKQCHWSRDSTFKKKKKKKKINPSGNYQTVVLDNKLWRVEASEETSDFEGKRRDSELDRLMPAM